MASASSRALRRVVPWLSSEPTNCATPAKAGGSASAPDLTTNRSVTIGKDRRGITTTCSPFARRCTLGVGRTTGFEGKGAGGKFRALAALASESVARQTSRAIAARTLLARLLVSGQLVLVRKNTCLFTCS